MRSQEKMPLSLLDHALQLADAMRDGGGEAQGEEHLARLRNEKSTKKCRSRCSTMLCSLRIKCVQCSACLAVARTERACGGGGSCAVGSKHVGTIPAIHVANAMKRVVSVVTGMLMI
jgi:hypothetical protein